MTMLLLSEALSDAQLTMLISYDTNLDGVNMSLADDKSSGAIDRLVSD